MSEGFQILGHILSYLQVGENVMCISIGYAFGNHVLLLHLRLYFRPYIQRYSFPNENLNTVIP